MTIDYGYDIGMGPTLIDLDPNMIDIGGRTLLVQSCVRRLVTYRGTLIDDPNYGTDVRVFLNDDVTPTGLAMYGAAVDAELVKDERVLRSSTTCTFVANVLMLSISLVDGAGPFRLTLAVSNVTVTLLTVTAT